MRLDQLIDRTQALEERAAALYRVFAIGARDQPTLCALWTGLARDEEQHARSLAAARRQLPATAGWQTHVEGWQEALDEIELRLASAEQLEAGAHTDRQLAAALELEMSELETLRHALLVASRAADVAGPQTHHAKRFAELATQFSDDAQVRLQAALLRARAHLRIGRP